MTQEESTHIKWAGIDKELKELLRLRTDPVAYKRLEREGYLAKAKGVVRVPQAATFCQVLYMARVLRLAVGVTRSDKVGDRCMRIHGTLPATEGSMRAEAEMFSPPVGTGTRGDVASGPVMVAAGRCTYRRRPTFHGQVYWVSPAAPDAVLSYFMLLALAGRPAADRPDTAEEAERRSRLTTALYSGQLESIAGQPD